MLSCEALALSRPSAEPLDTVSDSIEVTAGQFEVNGTTYVEPDADATAEADKHRNGR